MQGVIRIRVRRTIPAPVDMVWEDVEDLASHVEWMADAESIRFTSSTRAGVGTTFDCRTKVGPFRLTDRMEVTEWRAHESIGVRHVGLVTGTGRFTLRPARLGRATRFAWEEELRFPWWLGGRLGEVPGSLVLRLLWRRNLRRLRARFR
jgi:uncharacterized protein YndB with AHSA1/START domain